MEKIKMELSLEEINLVLEALGKKPYETVYQLIPKIHTQAKKQLNRNGQLTKEEAMEEVKAIESPTN